MELGPFHTQLRQHSTEIKLPDSHSCFPRLRRSGRPEKRSYDEQIAYVGEAKRGTVYHVPTCGAVDRASHTRLIIKYASIDLAHAVAMRPASCCH